jgi:hypothetical protein
VNAYFTRFFVIRQDLNSGIASPKTIFFESKGLVVLVKTADRLGKKVFKEIDFEFFSCLTKGGFSACFTFDKNLVQLSL